MSDEQRPVPVATEAPTPDAPEPTPSATAAVAPAMPVERIAPLPDPQAPLPRAHAAGSEPVSWQWPSVHPEGLKFAGIVGGGALLAFLFGWTVIGWLLLGATAFTAAFFRDPVRASPAGTGLILSPADGLISQIMTVALPRQLVGEGGLADGAATRVSIFMSVFDVHINRSPFAGTVTRMAYVPGAFLNADLDKASEENERQYFVIEGADGTRIGFTQIAGLIARRILAFVREGHMVAAGQRVGLIRFGSRVDVFLPADFAVQVVKGQRAVAGETVLAVRGGTTRERGAVH